MQIYMILICNHRFKGVKRRCKQKMLRSTKQRAAWSKRICQHREHTYPTFYRLSSTVHNMQKSVGWSKGAKIPDMNKESLLQNRGEVYTCLGKTSFWIQVWWREYVYFGTGFNWPLLGMLFEWSWGSWSSSFGNLMGFLPSLAHPRCNTALCPPETGLRLFWELVSRPPSLCVSYSPPIYQKNC